MTKVEEYFCTYLKENIYITMTFHESNFPVKPPPRISCENYHSCREKNVPCKHAGFETGNEFLQKAE